MANNNNLLQQCHKNAIVQYAKPIIKCRKMCKKKVLLWFI